MLQKVDYQSIVEVLDGELVHGGMPLLGRKVQEQLNAVPVGGQRIRTQSPAGDEELLEEGLDQCCDVMAGVHCESPWVRMWARKL
jgi:hypothetical protein